MFNLSETAKISCHYEPFTTVGVIFKKTDKLIYTPITSISFYVQKFLGISSNVKTYCVF